MRGKKGLSDIVTTILIILIVLVAIGIIWGVVYNVIIKGTNSISLGQFTLDLKITSAKINYTTGIATVKVARNSGEGELKSIKFVVEDDRNSDIFERDATGFVQLATRTYDIDLTESEILVLENIHKISIAPVYLDIGSGGSGESREVVGRVADSISGLDELNGSSGLSEEEDIPTDCSVNSDCGEDGWVEGTEYCGDGSTISQAYIMYTCLGGLACMNETEIRTSEVCNDGYYCSGAECIQEPSGCTQDTDCGTSGYSGPRFCNLEGDAVFQNYMTYSCNTDAEQCSSESVEELIENCTDEEICEGGSCFIVYECSQRIDPACDLGEVCDLDTGTCVAEEVVASGSVRSAWPYGSGEYFDSPNLPQNDSLDIIGYSVIFPGSAETRCLRVYGFVPPQFDGGISYVRLNSPQTLINDGDSFELWETDYICSTI